MKKHISSKDAAEFEIEIDINDKHLENTLSNDLLNLGL
jgi:hypothetical protein